MAAMRTPDAPSASAMSSARFVTFESLTPRCSSSSYRVTDGPRVTFDDLRRHLDHFLDLGGEGHLALGADLDGCSVLPEGFAALNDYETLGRYLTDAGYPDETIQNLFCNSLMKVVKTCIM